MKTRGLMKTILVLICFLSAYSPQSNSQEKPKRVEPPFWWSGMKNNELQLMIWGTDIGLTHAEIDFAGVRLNETVYVDNPNYLFLYLELLTDESADFDIRFVRDGKVQYEYNFELKTRQKNADYFNGFNSSDAIYLLMPEVVNQKTLAFLNNKRN